jgi:hypothetical protein
VLEQLDLVGGYPPLNDVGSGDLSIVPMKEPMLDEPLVISEDVVLCPIGHPIGRGDILAGDTLVFLHIGSNSGNNVTSHLGFPWCIDGAG